MRQYRAALMNPARLRRATGTTRLDTATPGILPFVCMAQLCALPLPFFLFCSNAPSSAASRKGQMAKYDGAPHQRGTFSAAQVITKSQSFKFTVIVTRQLRQPAGTVRYGIVPRVDYWNIFRAARSFAGSSADTEDHTTGQQNTPLHSSNASRSNRMTLLGPRPAVDRTNSSSLSPKVCGII